MRIACLLMCAVLAACTAPTIDPDWANAAAGRHGDPRDEGAIAARLLSGFDRRIDADITAGDRVLYRVTLNRGNDIERAWLVRLTVANAVTHFNGIRAIHTTLITGGRGEARKRDVLIYRADLFPDDGKRKLFDSESTVTSLDVEVFDDTGRPLGQSRVFVGSKFLRTGFVTACESTSNAAMDARRLESIQVKAHSALLAFLGTVKRDPVLREIFWQVVRLPTLWSIVTKLGVKLRLVPEFEATRVAEAVVGGKVSKAWTLPFQVRGNEQPMLLASLRAVEPLSPLTICAGITSLVAVKPGDPTRSMTIQLLAARRGPVVDEPRD